MREKSSFDGRDPALIERFLREVTDPDYDGPAPDLDAVAVVRAVIAHQHSIESMTTSLGLTEQSAAYVAACVDAVLPGDPTPAEILAAVGQAAEPVRRAVAYMSDNLREEVDVADIAAAGNVSIRALQLAFRHEFDTTPMAYLRDMRMNAAHAELENRSPGDGSTVSEVAMGWGFPHPGRFAVAYRVRYGRAPHTTLADRSRPASDGEPVTSENQAPEANSHDETDDRAVIEQAKGILMRVYGVDADHAFAILSRRSRETGLAVDALAAQLIEDSSHAPSAPPGTVQAFDSILNTLQERISRE
ncbi:helix-turn-helix domain-containing protein [Nocardia sp. NPDC005978]|uniref:helix-turn-helix domain-containing protein n=1 Tax=Nocardia sp. NPDC005978 TaxID=3156725 RepID=UPI0033B3DA8A